MSRKLVLWGLILALVMAFVLVGCDREKIVESTEYIE